MKAVIMFAALGLVLWTAPTRAEELCVGPACIGVPDDRDRDEFRDHRDRDRDRDEDRHEGRRHRDHDQDRHEGRRHRDRDHDRDRDRDEDRDEN